MRTAGECFTLMARITTVPSSILLVHQGHELYGSDRTFIQSVRAVVSRWPAATITVLLPKEGELSRELLAFVDDVRIEDLSILRKSDLRTLTLQSFRNLIRKVISARQMMLSYELTYINTVVVLDYIVAAAIIGGRSIIHVHEIPSRSAASLLSILIALSRASLIFNSQATLNSFHLLNYQSQKVIWNGISLSQLEDRGWDDDQSLHILLIGRISSWKGHQTLLQAIILLPPERRRRLAVRMVGGVFGEQTHLIDDLNCQIEGHALSEFISIVPFSRDPTEHYAWSDVVVVPSIKPEPFGLVAIEAMAAGRAVIAANHGGLREVVVDGTTGILVQPNSPQALADAICVYLDNPDQLRRDGHEGRRRFELHFTEAVYMSRVIDTIEQACGKCKPTEKRSSQRD